MLEDHTVLCITYKVLSVVVEGAMSTIVKIDWLDEILGEILREREHHELMQDIDNLKGQIEEVRRQLDYIKDNISRCQRSQPVET